MGGMGQALAWAWWVTTWRPRLAATTPAKVSHEGVTPAPSSLSHSRPPSGGQGTAAWLGWGEARRLSRGLGVLAPCGSRPQRDDSKQPRRLCRLVPESQRRHPGCLLWAQSSIQAPLERKTGSTLGMPRRTQTLDPERKGRGGRCQTRIAVWATTPGPLARAPLVLPSTPAQKSPGSAPSRWVSAGGGLDHRAARGLCRPCPLPCHAHPSCSATVPPFASSPGLAQAPHRALGVQVWQFCHSAPESSLGDRVCCGQPHFTQLVLFLKATPAVLLPADPEAGSSAGGRSKGHVLAFRKVPAWPGSDRGPRPRGSGGAILPFSFALF